MKDRAPEAEMVLRKALALDPKNPFTLNNLGYALEKEGELEQAVRFYARAAASGSNEKIVVALNHDWRGRSISEIASRNAQAARRELSSEGDDRGQSCPAQSARSLCTEPQPTLPSPPVFPASLPSRSRQRLFLE